ncbi:unnamed protein product [Pleuronectes platessa]|uniref:Sleeping Beauty transposase HTH domain-containing protein n=1 Tax=Pleuronectes platessa TaxID=8262 RepID=A0A9N7W320_PLEPL|nr:unnamed protein product [Pleuronectes platessa]
MAAGRCECICTHSEAKTFGGWPGVKKGSKEATSLQEKHQGQTDILPKGFTGKDVAASKIAPKSTIYRIIKNFKESGSIVVKKASRRPRKSSKCKDRLVKLLQLQDRGTTSAEVAQEWQHAGIVWGIWKKACLEKKSIMKTKELTKQVRDKVVEKYEAGLGYKKISRALNISLSTIKSIIRKWKE